MSEPEDRDNDPEQFCSNQGVPPRTLRPGESPIPRPPSTLRPTPQKKIFCQMPLINGEAFVPADK